MGYSEKDDNTGMNGALCKSYIAHTLFLWKLEGFIQHLTEFFFKFLGPLLCYQVIGSGESEINDPHSVLFIFEGYTCINKNKMSCQGYRETITSDQ